MNWPTVREFIAYCFGNVLGLAAAAGAVGSAWELATGRMDLPFGLLGFVGSSLVAYWWGSWALREYVRPSATRTESQSSDTKPAVKS